MPGPERNTTRSIYLHPTGEGDKAQWTAVGAATDWQAVSRGITPLDSNPAATQGVETTADGQINKFTFGSFAGSLNAGEYVNYLRPWIYVEEAPAAAPSYSTSVLADAPTAYYRLNESSGTTATNSSSAGATHNGTYVNTPTLAEPGALLNDSGTAVAFASAQSERVTATTLGTWGQSAVNATVEMWVKTTNNTTKQALFGAVNTGTAFQFVGWINAAADGTQTGSQLLLEVRSATGGGELRVSCGANTMFDGEWHHLVFRVESGSTASIWVDGTQMNEVYANVGGGIANAANLGVAMAIAARNNNGTFDSYFDGSLDEVAFYPTRLVLDRLAQHYQVGSGNASGGAVNVGMVEYLGHRDVRTTGWHSAARSAPFTHPDKVLATSSVGTLQIISDVDASIPAPLVKGVGAATSGTGAVTPAHPTGTGAPVVGDVKLIVAETAGGEAITVPTNWAHITGSPVDEGGNTRLSVIWKRHASGDTAQSIGDPGNHVIARMFTISGCRKTGNPWDVVNTGTEATSDTSVSYPDATTTLTNTLVFQAVSAGLPDANSTTNFTVGSNGNLTSITERADNWTSAGTGGTGGGGIGVLTGIKATASAIGNTTATLGTASSKAMMTVAFAPQNKHYVTAAVMEVGVSTMEHLVASGRQFVGAKSRTPWTGTFAQYPSLAFDNWLVDESDANIRMLFREMRLHQLDMVRVFVPFGTMMVTATLAHEEKFQRLEETLRIALEENVRIDMTGVVMFDNTTPTFVPDWLDALSQADRWLAIRIWWRRCADACAGNPAVALYCLFNEALSRNDGGSWYVGSGPWQFAQYIINSYGAYTKAQQIQNWVDDVVGYAGDGIRGVDPMKPAAFGGNESRTETAYLAATDMGLQHFYAFYGLGNEPYDNVINESRNILVPSGKPLVIEEMGSDPNTPQPLNMNQWDQTIGALQTVYGSYVAGGGNWRGAWGSFLNPDHLEWVREAYIMGRWALRADRIAPPRGIAARIGQRFR